MRHLLLTLILIPLFVHSQWRTRTDSNKFDGKYKIAYVVGSGGEWPYKNPTLNIIRWNEDEPDIYISNIRYTGCDKSMIEITFNNTEEIYTYNANSGIDDDSAFIEFNSKNYSYYKNISMVELIELLKKKNRIYIRYSDNCGNEDYEFSLNGSTRAIDFVAKEYFEKECIKLEEEKELEEIRAEIARKEKEELKLLQLQIEKKAVEKFEKDLLAAFQFGDLTMDQSLLKELMPLKLIELTTTLRYCFKQDSKGRTFGADEQTFFSSDRLTLYNRIAGDCILMTNGKWGGQFTIRYYIKINDLAKNTDNPKIQVIKEKWDELVKLSTKK